MKICNTHCTKWSRIYKNPPVNTFPLLETEKAGPAEVQAGVWASRLQDHVPSMEDRSNLGTRRGESEGVSGPRQHHGHRGWSSRGQGQGTGVRGDGGAR